MKQRVANYIADFLASNGITDVFTVTGGGAMHLNDAFGHHPKLHCTYNHHEQGCSIAAEGYTRYSGKIAAVCVTSGPGGTNAITGVLGGWLDSIPMFIISGQVKFSTTIRSSNLPLRQLGDQEFDITNCVKNMTKFADMIISPQDIAYLLEKALFTATHGRPGPVWLDIPLNIQSAIIETEDLKHYNPTEDKQEISQKFSQNKAKEILEKIHHSHKPVIFAGSAIRSSGAYNDFITLIEKLNIPVVTAWNANDILYDEHPLYCGRPGTVGNRGGNFVVQNCDLLLIIGSRLNIRQISYNYENFSPNSYKILIDIDVAELFKPTLNIDLPIYANVKDVIKTINKEINANNVKSFEKWLDWCKNINAKYPVCIPEYYNKKSPINPYVFIAELFKLLTDGDSIVCGNGSACVCAFQAAIIKNGQRLFTNSGCASMGYGLPAALGVAVAKKGERVICLDGDGSLQMNLQELQTIIHNKLNVKIFWLNNNGYHSIRQTQTNLFKSPLVGVCSDNGISFPEAEKIANAYNIPFVKINSINEIKQSIEFAFNIQGPSIIEVILDAEQFFEPKLSSKQLPDGSIISPPLDDMYPFLPQEEMSAIKKSLEKIDTESSL